MTAAGRNPTKSRAHNEGPARRRATAERSAPSRARRISGPVTAPRPATNESGNGIALRVFVGLRSIPDHSLLDRLVRGRMWIPLLGVLLAGVVATQVEVLRLNASMGHALHQSASLLVRNEALRASVAELSDDARIERLAAGMGMVMPGPTTLSFVNPQTDVSRAIQNIHSPDPNQFAAQLPSADATAAGDSSTASSSGSTDTSGSGSSSGG
jgi:hypothetical protein